MSTNYTKRTIKLSSKYTAEERRAIAAEITGYIIDRTKAGKGKDNKSWTPPANKYSKEYKSSLDFKLKADKSKVNLTLTGDMLDSIKLLGNKEGEITIGIPKSDGDYGKAEGNIRGTYGKKRGSPSRARDFMSVSRKETSKILEDFPLDDKEALKENIKLFKAALAAAKEITGEKGTKNKIPTLGQINFRRDDE